MPLYSSCLVLLRPGGSAEVNCPAPGPPEPRLGRHRGGAGGVRGAEPVVTLVVHVDTARVNLCGAPGGSCRLAAVDPVSTRVIGHPRECEGEDTGLASSGATGGGACAGGGCGGGDDGARCGGGGSS